MRRHDDHRSVLTIVDTGGVLVYTRRSTLFQVCVSYRTRYLVLCKQRLLPGTTNVLFVYDVCVKRQGLLIYDCFVYYQVYRWVALEARAAGTSDPSVVNE